MTQTGKNVNSGRQKLYIVYGRWMKEWRNDGMIQTREN